MIRLARESAASTGVCYQPGRVGRRFITEYTSTDRQPNSQNIALRLLVYIGTHTSAVSQTNSAAQTRPTPSKNVGWFLGSFLCRPVTSAGGACSCCCPTGPPVLSLLITYTSTSTVLEVLMGTLVKLLSVRRGLAYLVPGIYPFTYSSTSTIIEKRGMGRKLSSRTRPFSANVPQTFLIVIWHQSRSTRRWLRPTGPMASR